MSNYTIDRPVRFAGSDEERNANYYSHLWSSFDPEEAPRCAKCDAVAWGRVSEYPCGADVPREVVTIKN